MTDGNAIFPPPLSHVAGDYAALKCQVKEAGLLEKQPRYYLSMLVLLVALLALSVVILLFVKPFWLQLLNAAFLAFLTTQFGLLGHAAGHRQLFHKSCHNHPNEHDVEHDVFIPIIAFAPEDLQRKGKLLLGLMRYQAYFFFPLLSLALLSMQINSIQHLFQKRLHYPLVEQRLLLFLHFALYFGLLFSRFPLWQALVFLLAHSLLSGISMGSIFAPNHKGMPVLEKNNRMDFLHRQVLTARNVYAHPLTDFWYGGLNYQIEHHLFPGMAQNKLKEALPLVRAFCQAQALSYYETTIWQSYQETVSSLHEVTAPLRKASLFS